MFSRRDFLFSVAAVPLLANVIRVGPRRGSLVVAGGGILGSDITSRFIELAGGKDAPILWVPTADTGEEAGTLGQTFLTRAGCSNLSVLHTRNREEADSEAFASRVRRAKGVWFAGGRQWRLVDSYLNTRTQRELFALLDRDGVIGGTSAGATIQGSYLVRGARENNVIMMSPGYEEGFGLLRGVAVDQHLIVRGREDDLLQVIHAHPELLGIGIDESTAIVVRGDHFEVIGRSKVAIYDRAYRPAPGQKSYFFLSPGERFDLAARRRLPSTSAVPTEVTQN
ncbi:MAG: cyanophycinase [Bryobacteraceae bacterium]|nr:cyanophycinase [Bryobacteraceae bacterium]